MWKTDLRPKAEAYAKRRGLELLEPPLGDGTEGNVWTVRSKRNGMRWAMKMHRHRQPYACERDVYKRLAENDLVQVLGLNVPQLIRWDDEALVIEMTIVARPYVLDFAAAYLDWPPDFTDEVWAESEARWRDVYGEDWALIRRLMDEFEAMGIYLTDLHPGNVAPSA